MSFTNFRHLFLSSVSPSSTVIFSSGVLLSFKVNLMSVNSRSFFINYIHVKLGLPLFTIFHSIYINISYRFVVSV